MIYRKVCRQCTVPLYSTPLIMVPAVTVLHYSAAFVIINEPMPIMLLTKARTLFLFP